MTDRITAELDARLPLLTRADSTDSPAWHGRLDGSQVSVVKSGEHARVRVRRTNWSADVNADDIADVIDVLSGTCSPDRLAALVTAGGAPAEAAAQAAGAPVTALAAAAAAGGRVAAAAAVNTALPPEIAGALSRSTDPTVRRAVAAGRVPAVVLSVLASDADPTVRRAVAGNPACRPDVRARALSR